MSLYGMLSIQHAVFPYRWLSGDMTFRGLLTSEQV